MNILVLLIPASLALGGLALAAFLWMLRTEQYEDPDGQAHRVLSDRYDDHPAGEADPTARASESQRTFPKS